MDLGIAGKRAAVAASSAGLGLETARALAEAGASLAICGRSQDRVDAAAASLPGEVIPMVADLSTGGGARDWTEAAADALGGIDILVANNGGPPRGDFASTDYERYPEALEGNLLSTVAMCQVAIPAMRERRWGRVLAITSVSVRQPIGDLILSNTARAGATNFLKTVALEVAADGVTVNTIQPGLHLTDRLGSLVTDSEARDRLAAGVPAREIGDPADFGEVAAFLCSEPARYITGASIPVDGGAHRGMQ